MYVCVVLTIGDASFLLRSSKEVSSDIIVVSDEDSPTSSDSGGLKLNANNMNEVSNIARHHQVSTSADANDPGVQALKELLQKEEKKLSVLKTIHGLQGAVTTTTKPAIQGSALNKATGRSSGSGNGRNSPNFRPSQAKHSIVVVPGNQASKSSSLSSSSVNMTTAGISSRLQQLVDNIAADQALTSCSLSSAGSAGKASGIQSRLISLTAPPIPSLTSAKNSQKHSMVTLSSDELLQFTSANKLLRPKTSITSSRSSSHEIITISDSSIGKTPPPPLLPSGSSRISMTNGPGSIQVPTISSTALPRVSTISSINKKYGYQNSDNSGRFRDYIVKQNHAKRTFQKQIERKMVVAPYPKTFRQVWPLIPVYDSSFVRNFGMEAVMHYFDPNSKANLEKTNSKVKPVCNQCGCDFASAWQIRKSNSKQLLLCEACDFQNLKILQRSKLGNQLKELLESIKKDEEKFGIECEEARRRVLEEAANEKPPPLTSQLASSNKVANALGHINQVVLNNQVSNRVQALAASEGKKLVQSRDIPSSGTSTTNQHTIVIPSTLGQRTHSNTVGVKGELGQKRRDAPTGDVAPPSKVCKPGSTLDLTLNRLSKQLIKKKLDEKRQECQEQEKMVVITTESEGSGIKMESGMMNRDTKSPSPSDGRRAKSRRKGTPKHKRLLSSSSIGSE